MRVLITGGAGFIGSHIADAHIARGDEVLVVDDLSTGSKENINKKAMFVEQNIISRLDDIFRDFKPDLVNHHAAQINVRRSEKNPVNDAEINILGTINLLQACKNYKVRHFIFSSSGGTVYGETDDRPTREDHSFNPLSPYGISKLAGENYIKILLSNCVTRFTILRYANVYGPRQNPLGEAGVVAIFLSNILNKKPCIIFGDGNDTRDYVYVLDCVAINLQVLDKPPGIYNIGTGLETSVNQLVEIIKDVIGGDFEYQYDDPRPGDLRNSCLDIEKAKKDFGWRPRVSLRAGIENTYKYFKTVT